MEKYQQYDWLIRNKVEIHDYEPSYGDLTILNKNQLILKYAGKKVLNDIVSYYLQLLGTSTAIYEKSGDYALGIFFSNWCKYLDQASRKLCITDNNQKALKCGKWLCHESCWTDASKRSIENDKTIDIECHGGLHIHAIPIKAGGKIIGSINFGYGDPPKDIIKLEEIAKKYKVSKDKLNELSQSYESRPNFIIEIAKNHLKTSAELIGNLIQLKQTEQKLKEGEKFLSNIFSSIQEGICVLDRNYNIIRFNHALEMWFPDLKNSSEKKCYEIFYNKNKPCKDCVCHNLILTGEKILCEKIYQKSTEKVFNVFTFPLIDRTTGNFGGIIKSFQDITEKVKVDQKIKRSQERFKFLYNNAQVAMFSVSIDGKPISINDLGLKMLGYSSREEFFSKFNSFNHWANPADRFKLMEELKEKGQVYNYQTQSIRTNGEKFWSEFSIRLQPDKKQLDAVAIDITDRKKAEQKLKESEEKSKEEANKLEILNQIMKESHNAKDLSLLLENTLKSTLDLMNFDGGGIYLLKENMREAELVYHKGLPSDFIEKVKRINIDQSPRDTIFIKGQPIFTENYPKIDPQHSIKWGILSLASIPLFATDRVIGAINIALTKRHFFTKIEKEILQSIGRDLGTVVLKMQAEEKLKESEEKFRTIAEQSLIGIIIIQERNVKYTNFANTMISGFTMKEILDWTIEDLFKTIYSDDLPLVKEQLRRGQKNDKDFIQYVCRIKTKYGKIRWVKIFSRNIIYQHKEAVLVSIIDISEQKKAEQELINLSKLKSELFTRASHELKTPLISIKGYTELLLELYKDKFDNMAISSLNQIKHGSERLEKTINNILNTSYLESEQLQLDLKEEDLSFLIKYCINEFQGLAKSRHHNISVHIQNNLFTKIEKERIYEVLSNLIINAIKYTPPNGTIEINTETKENFYIISIKDNGIGFTEEEKERIFKQFGKIERYGYGWDLGIDGTGLGLYISKKIIELHGGEIWMESEGRNRGSTFYFSLPII